MNTEEDCVYFAIMQNKYYFQKNYFRSSAFRFSFGYETCPDLKVFACIHDNYRVTKKGFSLHMCCKHNCRVAKNVFQSIGVTAMITAV